MRTCLVVMDMQEGNATDWSREISGRIKRAYKRYNFDYAAIIRFVNREDGMFETKLGYRDMEKENEQELLPAIKEMAEGKDCRIFDKTGYSCVTDEFKQYLAGREISKLYFTGMDMDGCVLASAFDAFKNGFEFWILEDMCLSAGGADAYNAAVTVMKRSFGEYRVCGSEFAEMTGIMPERRTGRRL